MKKISLLFVVSLTLGLFTTQAQKNLIKDGKFENTYFNVNDIVRKMPDKGVWFPYLTGDRLAVLSVVDDEEKGKAVMFQSLTHVSYAYSYVGQRIQEDLDAGIYQVGFWAKSLLDDPKPVVNVYLRVNTSPNNFLFFKLADVNPEENPNKSIALWQKHITGQWKYYTIDFDLGQTVNNAGNYKLAKDKGTPFSVVKSAKMDRKDLYLGISSTTRNAQFLFTDVTLTKVK